ncbi:hypothetical protein [Microbacterium sp. AR7-10]|uniref:hypothetical protein n=1 Tax=Microbacterium sp. AR7-10 TaxID=1891970 RepID=UPI0008FC315D|nr:hypothetical protein [Microbacterium sp. AR7-10]OIU84613.1 hypothetical protein BFN01_02160 [Microbacterium sp. AR7-10]
MTVLKDLRTGLAEAITAVTTYDHVPGRVLLPAAFVLAGSPYIEQGETFGDRLIRFQIVVCTHPSLNEIETDSLDQIIESASEDLAKKGWAVESVQQPAIQELNGAEVFATEINVAALVTFD